MGVDDIWIESQVGGQATVDRADLLADLVGRRPAKHMDGADCNAGKHDRSHSSRGAQTNDSSPTLPARDQNRYRFGQVVFEGCEIHCFASSAVRLIAHVLLLYALDPKRVTPKRSVARVKRSRETFPRRGGMNGKMRTPTRVVPPVRVEAAPSPWWQFERSRQFRYRWVAWST